MSCENRITREDIIEAFKELPDDSVTTTFRIAQRLECDEHQVRAAVSWLVMGGLLFAAGETVRKDSQGRKYTAKLYSFSGDDEIRRVPRDPTDRKIAIESRCSEKVSAFLSRRW